MRHRHIVWIGAVVVLSTFVEGRAQTPAGTAFTYQGQLKKAGSPVNGLTAMMFTLWDDPNSTDPNHQVGPTLIFDGVVPNPPPINVNKGLFTVGLDFGSGVFTDKARWLEIQILPSPPNIPLSPRQKLTPAPYALALPGLWTQQTPGTPNVVGGYSGNLVGNAAEGAVIAGGGYAAAENKVYDHYSTIGGGLANTAGDDNGDPGNMLAATVAGGLGNAARADWSTVGGGGWNIATGHAGTVAGGSGCRAQGDYSAVPGGYNNWAAGPYSFAAGRRASIGSGDAGTFIWADSTDAEFPSTAANQFLIRAAGGVGVNKNNPTAGALDVAGLVQMTAFKLSTGATAGHVLTADASGLGTWQPATGGGAGWSLTGNAGTDPNTNFLGTTDNVPLELRVNGERGLRIEPAVHSTYGSSPNLIAGHADNIVTAGASGAVVFGTSDPNSISRVTDHFGTVAGGFGNRAGDDDGNPITAYAATVGGGWGNVASETRATVSGGNSNVASGIGATVSGGMSNDASGGAATVSGGNNNDAAADYATVSGGDYNKVTGDYASVPGGEENQAGGRYSFAAGRRAKVRDPNQALDPNGPGDQGTFVWADSTNADFQSTASNQFLVRATGGVGIGTNAPDPNLALLTVNGTVRSMLGGFRFPDGTLQTTAATGGGGYWSSSGSDIYNNNAGNVGIGTPSPVSPLHVQSSDEWTWDVGNGWGDFNVGNGTYGLAIGVALAGGGAGTVRVWPKGDPNNGEALIFGNPVADDILTIGNTGNVGIGQTNPNRKLYVLEEDDGLSFPLKLDNPHSTSSDSATGILFSVGGQGSPNNLRGKGGLVYECTNTWNRGDFHFLQESTANSSNPGLANAVMTIKNGGDVGIGTTAPLGATHISNNDLGLTAAALENDDLIVESWDAAIGLYSRDDGTWGSAIALKDLQAGGTLNDTWGIARKAANAGSALHFTYGPSDNYATNPAMLRIEPAVHPTYGSSPNLIAGHASNVVTAGAVGAIVFGTSDPNEPNAFCRATDDFGTVGGGFGNRAGNGDGDPDNARYATVSGGRLNAASDYYATVSGGNVNAATGSCATVSGGQENSATGDRATVPGGYRNQAGGYYSFAAGQRAKVRDPNQSGDYNGDEGTFVWADSTNDDFGSTGRDQFLIRAGGGVGIGTNSPNLAQLQVETSGTYAYAIVGKVTAPLGAAVWAWNNGASGEARGLEATSMVSPTGTGVYGEGKQKGVKGKATAPSGVNYGVYGSSNSPDGYGGYFEGKVSLGVLEIRGGSDLAEPFSVSSTEGGEKIAPGMVVVIDPDHPGQLKLATERYDRKVAGVISGANGLKAGMVMKSEGKQDVDGDHPVALTGRVYAWADASAGAIEPGDLLTTADTPGHAMKVTDCPRAQGAIIGKAMTTLKEGKGLVLILVQPQ